MEVARFLANLPVGSMLRPPRSAYGRVILLLSFVTIFFRMVNFWSDVHFLVIAEAPPFPYSQVNGE